MFLISLILAGLTSFDLPSSCLIMININEHAYEVGYNKVESEDNNPYTEDEKAKARVKANIPPIL
jgi:hypothetical protein